MLTVLNGYKSGWTGPNKIYIGRQNLKLKLPGSPLANPFPITGSERSIVVDKFKQWLESQLEEFETKGKVTPAVRELARLVSMYEQGKPVMLVCYCVPKQCHGQVIAQKVREYAKIWSSDFLEEILTCQKSTTSKVAG